MSDSSFDSILSSVLGNEELMGKISSIMNSHNGDKDAALPDVVEALSSSIGKDFSKEEATTQEEAEKEKPTGASVAKSKHDFSKSARLLSALRPYMSDKRCQMIDNILKFEQIAEIIKLTR